MNNVFKNYWWVLVLLVAGLFFAQSSGLFSVVYTEDQLRAQCQESLSQAVFKTCPTEANRFVDVCAQYGVQVNCYCNLNPSGASGCYGTYNPSLILTASATPMSPIPTPIVATPAPLQSSEYVTVTPSVAPVVQQLGVMDSVLGFFSSIGVWFMNLFR